MIAPESFQLSDIDGSASAVNGQVAADLEDSVREAVRSCPEQAISLDGRRESADQPTVTEKGAL